MSSTPNLSNYHPFLGMGDFSEIYLEESHTLSIRWEDKKIETLSMAEKSGAGVRFINEFETRFGHLDLVRPFDSQLSSSSKEGLLKLTNQMGAGLRTRPVKSLGAISVKKHPTKDSPLNHSVEEKMELLKLGFEVAKYGPHVSQVTINYGEKIKKVGYLNSEGNAFIEDRIYLVFGITVTAEKNGILQTAYESMGGVLGYELFDKDSVKKLARLVCDRAHKKLDSPQAPVGEMPVIIASSAGGTLIHEAVGHSLEADAVLEGTSPAYKNKIGKVVANEKLTVYDDPTVPAKRGSFYFDDEGIPSEPSKLIENGVLKDYMFDRLSAKRAKRASNGHGRRESYEHRPIPRMSNTFIAPGPDDPKKIIDGFKNGLLVTKMGGGQVNTANGDFVFEVEEGFKVEDGKKTMIRGATLLGNGPDVLKDIDLVGSDHGWGIGTCGKEGQGVPVSDALPTIHIKKLIIGGQ